MGLALAGLAISSFLDVHGDAVGLTGGFEVPNTCLIRTLTEKPCPSCGMTRAFVLMAHGHFEEAVRRNSAGPLLFLVMMLQIPFRGARVVSSRWACATERLDGRLHMIVLVVAVVLLVFSGSARMIT